MNKYKLAGLILALILLICALAAMHSPGTGAVQFMLPILTVGLWGLMAVDIVSYRKCGSESRAIRSAELMRIISLGVVSVLMTFAAIISFFR